MLHNSTFTALSVLLPIHSPRTRAAGRPAFGDVPGSIGGCIGEVSALALLIGGGYLVVRDRRNAVTGIIIRMCNCTRYFKDA